MLELGDFAVESHKNVGKWVKEENIDCRITVGDTAKNIAEGAKEAGFEKEIYSFENNAEIISALTTLLKENDCILIKGSRGMRLEEVADSLYEGKGTEE